MLRINQSAFEALRRHGEETYPDECCGVLIGRMHSDGRTASRAARTANTRTDSPQNRYNIDPRDLIRIERESRERGEDIVGFYHSHPDHPAQWSATDLEEAHWFGCSYVITSVAKGKADQTNSFELAGNEDDKQFVEEHISVMNESKAASKSKPICVTVRVAVPADFPAIIPVVDAAYAIETFLDGPRLNQARIAEMSKTGEFLIAQVESEEDKSGSIVAAVYVEKRGQRGYFGVLAVDPSQQGHKLGRVMVQAAEDYCRDRDCKVMDLTVLNLRPELPPFYRKLGYIETGTEAFDRADELKNGLECHCIVMSKEL